MTTTTIPKSTTAQRRDAVRSCVRIARTMTTRRARTLWYIDALRIMGRRRVHALSGARPLSDRERSWLDMAKTADEDDAAASLPRARMLAALALQQAFEHDAYGEWQPADGIDAASAVPGAKTINADPRALVEHDHADADFYTYYAAAAS